MLEVIFFEFKYRSGRPATYIYFGLLFLLSFLFVATPAVQIGIGSGKVMENAPTVIAVLTSFMSWIALLITSAIMGVAVLRDYEHKTSSMLFTTTLTKSQYLFGRFIGSFLVLIFITSGIVLGFMLGHGVPWPWLDNADKLMPFNAWHYIQPYLVFLLPNIFIFGAIFFTGGALGKKMTVVYAQAVILFMGYLAADLLLGSLDNRELAALLDPFGIGSLSLTSQYWTVAEQNSRVIPFEGLVLTNRLIWMAVGIVALVILWIRFSFNVVGRSKKKAQAIDQTKFNIKDLVIPKVVQQFGTKASLIQIKELAIFYYKWIIKQVPFITIALTGIAFLVIIAFAQGTAAPYGIETYPSTSSMISTIGIFGLFFIIIIVFYSGELIWKERDVKINLIYDALPYPNYVSLTGKFLGFFLVHITLIFALILTAVLLQLIKGYTEIEWGLYFYSLYTNTLILMSLYTLLGIFIQTMVNHKFLGFALMIIFYVSFLVLGELGVEHNMFYFGRDGLGAYSEMNKFGHYLNPFSWFNIYWVAFAMILFAVSIYFSVRGTESMFVKRVKTGRVTLTRSLIIFVISTIVIFISSGAYIYYNTNVLNEYQNSEQTKKDRAAYEKELKQYKDVPQPKIVDTYVEVDIFPKSRDFDARGTYTLRNKTENPLSEIHIQKNSNFQFETSVEFKKPATIKKGYDNFKYYIYELEEPLQPGEDVKMDFEVLFRTEGFVESGSVTSVVYNGTFFNNFYFPLLGYSSDAELSDDDDREDNDLPEKERMMERDDPQGRTTTLLGDDADRISFEAILSTDSSQIAIAPGYLQKQWTEGDRTYYHYKMDQPMLNFYSIVSADYEVMKDVWKAPVDSLPDVNLEIYYHKGHEYNLDRMMRGMKKGLDYYTANFSPYQYRQIRIMEFPQYQSFAQSFANTIPFSEGIGFVQMIGEDDVDVPFYVTAHEVAHQWWAHQVTEAGVKGNAMLSETMSQYAALMVMKQEMPPEQIKRFLEYELRQYLVGRTFEQKKEMPLELVEGQGYIHYRKGSLIMYALQDYIGEDSVNAALRRFIEKWKFSDGIYPTSDELVESFRSVTPDSLQYLIKDFFETITLFENRTTDATYKELDNGKFKVNLTVSTIKYRADSLGNEESIPLKDWIDIGVFTEDEEGEDKLVYLKKHLITEEEQEFSIIVDDEPTKAGIDPINKLIDRNPSDNVKDLEKEEENQKAEPST